MDLARKSKIVSKMVAKGLATEGEDVSIERIEMFIKDIPLMLGEKTIARQIELRKKAIELCRKSTSTEMIPTHEKVLKKLEALEAVTVSVKEEKVQPKMKNTGAKTQREEVRNHMLEFGNITSWEAFMDYGITRLSAIIHKLRHDEGMGIGSETVTKKNRYGNLVNFSKYTHEKPNKEA